MANSTAVVSFLFPANLGFIDDFLNSLVQQEKKDFVLLLVVDSVPEVETYLKPYRQLLEIKVLFLVGTIASIRASAFKWMQNLPYDEYIFIDSDDVMSSDRIFTCCSFLTKYPVVVSDIVPFTDISTIQSEIGFWEERIEDRSIISWENLLTYNFVGLGNVAVRRDVIEDVTIPDHLHAIDWFIFFQWLQQRKGLFIHSGKVFYRQHDRNIIGRKKVNTKNLVKIAEVKVSHYAALCNNFSYLKSHLHNNMIMLERLRTDVNYCQDQVDYLNQNQINYFWWEETDYVT